MLGNAHPADGTRTSYRSQISSVFKHPGKRDLYIALADRWIPGLPDNMPSVYDIQAAALRGEQPDIPEGVDRDLVRSLSVEDNTAIADYVWLPIRFEGGAPVIEWLDEWTPEVFE